MKNEHVPGVPYGSFCYGHIPAPGSGFQTVDEVTAYLEKKYGDDWIASVAESDKLKWRKYCRYMKTSKHGFVECTHLKLRALIVSSEAAREKAVRHFGSEAKMLEALQGSVFGDAVKECGLNLEGGQDFTREKPKSGKRKAESGKAESSKRNRGRRSAE